MWISRRASRFRTAGYRLIGCAVALAAMASQVGGFAHLAFTLHIRCAEHGELVDAGTPASASAVVTRKDVRESHYVASGSGAAHGHEHCLVAPHRRDRGVQKLSRTAAATAELPFIARVVEAVGPPRTLDLLLIAPKNSPPA